MKICKLKDCRFRRLDRTCQLTSITVRPAILPKGASSPSRTKPWAKLHAGQSGPIRRAPIRARKVPAPPQPRRPPPASLVQSPRASSSCQSRSARRRRGGRWEAAPQSRHSQGAIRIMPREIRIMARERGQRKRSPGHSDGHTRFELTYCSRCLQTAIIPCASRPRVRCTCWIQRRSHSTTTLWS